MVIAEVVVTALMIAVILAAIRKIYEAIHGLLLGKNDGGLQIPSPPAYPLLRHFPYFVSNFNDDKKLVEWSKTYKKEGIFSFDVLLGPTRICVFKEEFMKQILVTNCTKYDRTPVLGEIFPSIKNGLFLSAGKEHAWQRKMLNPAFSYASVLEFLTTFDKNVDNLIMVWKEEAAKSLTNVAEIDIHKSFCRLTLDIIGETAFGYKFDTVVSGENKVSRAVDTLLTGKISVMSRLMRRIIPFYDKLLDRFSTELTEAQQITNAAVNEIIKKKREALKSTGAQDAAEVGKDLLGKMLLMQDEETGRKLTDELISAQVYTFMVAGFETTSVGLTWTFYLLAKHPEIQEKARKEAKAILNGSTTMTANQVDTMDYITAVINESLRMYPPAAIFMREAKKDDQLGDYKIPKGSFIIVPICAIHHLEENWPNHDQFDPERFLKKDGAQPEISNYKFMPFSNGPRNCIGRRFAMLEMKVTVAKLLNTFRFDLDPTQGEIGTNLRLSLKPHPKPNLRVSLLSE